MTRDRLPPRTDADAFGASTDALYPHEAASRVVASHKEGMTDVLSILADVEAALGLPSRRGEPPADRIAACGSAARLAIRRTLRGEEAGTPLGAGSLQSLLSALDDLSGRLARDAEGHDDDADDPEGGSPAPGGMA